MGDRESSKLIRRPFEDGKPVSGCKQGSEQVTLEDGELCQLSYLHCLSWGACLAWPGIFHRNVYFKHNEQEEKNSVFGSPIHNRPPPELIETLDLKLLLTLMMFLLSISTLVRQFTELLRSCSGCPGKVDDDDIELKEELVLICSSLPTDPPIILLQVRVELKLTVTLLILCSPQNLFKLHSLWSSLIKVILFTSL